MQPRTCLYLFLLGISLLPGTAQAEDAKSILDATGVQGGVIIHLDCGDGRLTAALHANDAYLVQGLDTSAKNVTAARERIRSAGLYGPVSVDTFDGKSLPYIENYANLIVSESAVDVPSDELMRVLVPNGVAYIKNGGTWTKTVKPRPGNIDDWTHYLHDSTNNAVAHDTAIGPPRHLQWIGSPRYSRQHDHMSGASAMVTANGRLFHIFDHATPFSIQIPSDWRLTARDAFNGTVLWERKIPKWHTQMFRLKSGPAQLTRRLVAIGDVVYVTLGLEAPVSVLDAVTGKTLQVIAGSEKTEELIYSNGVLFLLINDNPFHQPKIPNELNYDFVEGPRRIVAVDAKSGRTLWNKPQASVLPITLTADDQHVLFCGDDRIVCLNRATGKPVWQSEPVERRQSIPTFFGLTLVAYQDVVLFSGGSVERDSKNATGGDNKMYAFDGATGKLLWTANNPANSYKSAEDLLVMNNAVWVAENSFNSLSGAVTGYDLHSGKIVKQFTPDVETHWFHHRCYRAKATDDYLLYSRTGIEFVDPDTAHWVCNHWVRGACLYGIMPANGMVYNPPHPCACYLEAKMYGYNALAPATPSRAVPTTIPVKGRLERGPAYDDVPDADLRADDWPTYRNDASRSGFTTATVPSTLKKSWSTKIGGRLSAVTVACGKLFVASIDSHTVHALDAQTGDIQWSYTAGARVDSPPTIWHGRALFGSTDGFVYCLRIADGALAWRFRAAPVDRRLTSFEQIESVWPVHGSVLIRDAKHAASGKDELWCVAGRSMFVDGGLRLIRLKPDTGRLIDEKVLDDRDPESKQNLQVRLQSLNMPVALNDILSADDDFVYMRSQRFDADGIRHEIEVPTLDVRAQGEGAHLFSPTGFLDDVWWHRSYWIFGRVWKSGAGGYYQAGRVNPAGRPMVFNADTVFGYGRLPQYYRWTTPLQYQLFATAKRPGTVSGSAGSADAKKRRRTDGKKQTRPARKKGGGLGAKPNGQIDMNWTTQIPVLARAMVLANQTLFLAGPPSLIDEVETLARFEDDQTQQQLARQASAFDGTEGGILWVGSVKGEKLAQYKLDVIPAWDALSAANNRLFMATRDGSVVCFANSK